MILVWFLFYWFIILPDSVLLRKQTLILFFFPSTEKRRAEAARIREKYPDRIPVRFFFTFSLINYCRLGLSCCCSFYMMIYEAVFAFNNWLKLQSFILRLLGEGVFLFFSKTRSFNEIGGFAWSFKFWHEMIVGLYNEEELPKYFVVHFREQNTKSCVYFSFWKKLLKSWNNLCGRTCLNLVCFDMGFRGALIIWAWLLHWAEICGWV